MTLLLLLHSQVYAASREELATGGRVYIVCPLVSESSSQQACSYICVDALATYNAASAAAAMLLHSQVYAAIREELATGGRVYIVCPLVSESSSDALAGVKAAEEEYGRLVSSRVFDAHGCGLLHGKMKQQEKEAVLAKFNRCVLQLVLSLRVCWWAWYCLSRLLHGG
jgi:RecG-like helicase